MAEKFLGEEIFSQHKALVTMPTQSEPSKERALQGNHQKNLMIRKYTELIQKYRVYVNMHCYITLQNKNFSFLKESHLVYFPKK